MAEGELKFESEEPEFEEESKREEPKGKSERVLERINALCDSLPDEIKGVRNIYTKEEIISQINSFVRLMEDFIKKGSSEEEVKKMLGPESYIMRRFTNGGELRLNEKVGGLVNEMIEAKFEEKSEGR